MPRYVYAINGQRHVFEGPDPQSTAQFARRWAAQEAGRTPVTVADIQRRLGPKPSQFGMDIGQRAREDVGDLTGAIADVNAHPTSLLNGPKILGAVARYVPNAFGLAPAAGVDQAVGPVVRGVNARFGTHFDPRYATDQILNAAGFLSGAGEVSAVEDALWGAGRAPPVYRFLSSAGDTPAQRDVLPGPGESPPLMAHVGKLPQLNAPTPKPNLTVAYEAPELGRRHVLGQNSEGDNVVPLSEGFSFNHQQRMNSLEDLPDDIQDKYHSAIGDLIINPILDSDEYGGHNAEQVGYIRQELARMAAEQRGSGGNARLADALDAANEDFRIMVNQQQPEMAKALGLTRPGDSIPAPSSSADPDVHQTAPRGELVSYEQHAAPPPQRVGVDIDGDVRSYIEDMLQNWPKERILSMMKAWKDIDETANDNTPLPDWTGRAKPQPSPVLPGPEDFEPPTPLRDTLSPEEKAAWMKTAANAFSDPTSLNWTIVPRGPRQANGLDFNALRPPQWGPLGMVAAANQPLDSQQPQN